MTRFVPRFLALLLAGTTLAGCSMAGLSLSGAGDTKDKPVAAKEKPVSPKAAASDVDGNLRQAMLLRQAGSYDEAIHILSQLMLADADNPKVVAEYGKTLAQKGRAQDATQFLRRALELNPNDWTVYSALGVAFDQLGDQANARIAYEHALVLKPGEASVLNNYALSRMLAKDPDSARLLIAQAQASGGADAKIAGNVQLIAGLAPQKPAPAEKPTATASAVKSALANTLAPKTEAPKMIASAAPKPAQPPAPTMPKLQAPAPAPALAAKAAVAPPPPAAPQTAGDVARLLASQNPVANAAPRALVPQGAPQLAANEPPLPRAALEVAPGVVMQAVPYDPYAGPVTLKKPAPKPKAVAKAAPAKSDKTDVADKSEAKPAAQKTAANANVVPSLRVAADKY
ncbi:MAG: tetratricopeptide repeat protein [Alphaproteobacteria bacterium]|nr:tetratricopeptide repeat protein [Alphaproteobacteria bacterium]